MSPARVLRLAGRELRAGPRSPVFMMVIFMPLLITFLVRTVFLSVLEQEPRLAVTDLGRSVIPAEAESLPGLDITMADDADELMELVTEGAVDAGLLLREGFDDAVRSGERPLLELSFSEEASLTDRAVVTLSVLGLVRTAQGASLPVEVTVVSPDQGDELTISDRILPSIVMLVLIVAGIFAPAFMLVQERERGTIHALLVSPARMSEIIISKALLGFAMTMAVSYLTLALNGVSAPHPWALLATLVTAALMCVVIGMVYGCLAGSAKTLYTMVKTLNVLLAAPVVFYIFTDWPGWIAKFFPTYWFMDPLYRVTLEGAGFSAVRGDLAIAMLITILLAAALVPLTRRLRERI